MDNVCEKQHSNVNTSQQQESFLKISFLDIQQVTQTDEHTPVSIKTQDIINMPIHNSPNILFSQHRKQPSQMQPKVFPNSFINLTLD